MGEGGVTFHQRVTLLVALTIVVVQISVPGEGKLREGSRRDALHDWRLASGEPPRSSASHSSGVRITD